MSPLYLHNGKILVVNGALASSANCCCTLGPPCIPIVSWEIIDLTGGTAEILRSGNVMFEDIIEDPYGIIEDLPQPWITNRYKSIVDFNVINAISMALVLRYANGESVVVDSWSVDPNKCGGGLWWDSHYFDTFYIDPLCDNVRIYYSDLEPLLTGGQLSLTFYGYADKEWTNMRNWIDSSWELAELPGDEDISLFIEGSVWGDASGSALCFNLHIYAGGSLGTRVVCTNNATIYGSVIADSDNTFCGSIGHIICTDATVAAGGVNEGFIEAGGTVTLLGLNDRHNEVYGLITATSVVVDGGVNKSRIAAREFIDFYNSGRNECGSLEGDSAITVITFHDSSTNTGPNGGSELCPFFSIISATSVTFTDTSKNYTASFLTVSTLTFNKNSENRGDIQLLEDFGQAPNPVIVFDDDAGNYHKAVGKDITFQGSGINHGGALASADTSLVFKENSKNQGTAQGFTSIVFEDNADNTGIIESLGLTPVIFNDDATNNGTVDGNATFNNDTINNGTVAESGIFEGTDNAGTVSGGAVFNGDVGNNILASNTSTGIVNNGATFNFSSNFGTTNGGATFNIGVNGSGGTVSGGATFNTSSINQGTVNDGGSFNSNSFNAGTVNSGATFTDSQNSSDGIVNGNATFNGASDNYGTINGDATFNDSSNNFGTVTGTIICNTTGTCP